MDESFRRFLRHYPEGEMCKKKLVTCQGQNVCLWHNHKLRESVRVAGRSGTEERASALKVSFQQYLLYLLTTKSDFLDEEIFDAFISDNLLE